MWFGGTKKEISFSDYFYNLYYQHIRAVWTGDTQDKEVVPHTNTKIFNKGFLGPPVDPLWHFITLETSVELLVLKASLLHKDCCLGLCFRFPFLQTKLMEKHCDCSFSPWKCTRVSILAFSPYFSGYWCTFHKREDLCILADGYPGDRDTVQPASLPSWLPMELSRWH